MSLRQDILLALFIEDYYVQTEKDLYQDLTSYPPAKVRQALRSLEKIGLLKHFTDEEGVVWELTRQGELEIGPQYEAALFQWSQEPKTEQEFKEKLQEDIEQAKN